MVIALDELSGSKQSGVAALVAQGDKTLVVVNVTPGAAGVAQPIHIHNAPCGQDIGKVVHALTSLTDGKSTTTVNATLASLRTGAFVINGHKSAPEVGTYTTCGAIPTATSSITIALSALSQSGQSGYATLISAAAQTKVAISVTPGAKGVAQPIHIHNKPCGQDIGKVVYPLTSIVDGRSASTVDASLASLRTGAFAINGHKSAPEIATYIACGEIVVATATSLVHTDIKGFTLRSLTVKVGSTVVWTNQDTTPHTSTGVGGKWESGSLDIGKSFALTFKDKGTFAYFCQFHSFMEGTITVTD